MTSTMLSPARFSSPARLQSFGIRMDQISPNPGESAGTAPAHVSREQENASYRICLECALPLKGSEQSHPAKCQCYPHEDIEERWFDMEDGEILIAACLFIAFILICGGAWL